MKTLKMAVIGAGRLGGFHAAKVAARGDVELVGVVDPVEARRNEVAARCHTQALADSRTLLGQIDAAVIAAPTRLHHALALELLEHRIHLLVEKPLAATHAEADELVQSARRNNVVLQVGHVERFNPALAAALPRVRNPKYIEAVRSSPFTFRSTDIGVVLDLMIHDLDLVLSMVRSPLTRVDALGLSVLGGHEDVANARLEFESGCVATLSASRVSPQAHRRMQIWSERGYTSIDFASRVTTVIEPSEALLTRRFDVDSLTPEQVEYLKEHLFDEHLRREDIEVPPVDALELEIEDFVDSIRTPRSPRVTGLQGRQAIAAAEEILARINTHAWDDSTNGPVGPLAAPSPRVVPAPHWTLSPSRRSSPLREAG